MTEETIRSEIRRCEAEQAEIRARVENEQLPAWLVTLGLEDWEAEKRFFTGELQRIGGRRD